MVQWEEQLLKKQEDPSSDPQHPHKKFGIAVHICNPSTRRRR